MKFRNHISIIFENMIRSIGILFFIFIGNFLTSEREGEDSLEVVMYILLAVAVFTAIILIWQIIIWAKTYIIIQENTLVIERNTLNRKKNTIGLKNISNVNLEQNILEMMLGTCKVKLDTNTLSTADQTDVTIVLKKQDAQRFRQMILQKEEKSIPEEPVQTEQKKIVAGMDDIIVHGLFSINFFSVIVLVLATIGAVASVGDMLSELTSTDIQGDLLQMLMSILLMIWILGGAIWSVVKDFVKYIDFKIERRNDKIFMNYGLLKKVAYSIPVDKINAIRLTQTAFARLGKRYMVEVINVGLDNEENETQSFFLPYAKKEKIETEIKLLLPEFYDSLNIQEEKQDKCVWMISLPAMAIYLVCATLVFAGVAELAPEAKLPVLIVLAAISVLLLIFKFAGYLTKGVAVHEQFLKIVDGSFGRRILLVRYDKIQYICGKQNVIAKKYKMQKANLYVLAAMKNQVHSMPYFSEEKLELLKTYLIQG